MRKSPKKHFVLEKRFLLTKKEHQKVQTFIKALSDVSGTSVQLSQLVRAALLALQSARGEVERAIRANGPLIRPEYTDAKAMHRFEVELAKLLRGAIASSTRKARQRA